MPFKFRWPFHWPRRKRVAEPLAAPPTPAAPVEPTPAAPQDAAWRVPSPVAPPERPFAYTPEPGEGPDLGAELLGRLPQLSTPPTLGQLGGLPAMAQALPAVDRFLQQMPAAPVQRLLEGAWSEISQFTTALPSLSALGEAPVETSTPGFPEQLEAGGGAGLTDVLPPLGSLPGQASAISGEAPVLAAGPQTPAPPPVVQIIHEAGPAAAAPDMPVLRAAAPPASPGDQPAAQAGAPATPVAPSGPLLTPVPRAPEQAAGLAAMLQVISVESTLTGNVLPPIAAEYFPVLRELVPYAPVWRAAEEPAAPGAAPAPSEERVSPVQRAAIESQRGQGRPLEPAVRQRFESAYGASLNDVRVHTGQAAHATTQSLNAIAFASGPDLFFAHNTYQPQSGAGLGLLGHELAHVVQQQYGVAGDPDTLRPADDRYERQADQLAASALAAPSVTPTPLSAAPVQRALVGHFVPAEAEPPMPGTPGALLDRAGARGEGDRPLSVGGAAGAEAADDRPVQRFGLGDLGGLARQLPSAPSLPTGLPTEMPSLTEAADRVSGLTSQLPSAGGLLGQMGSLGNLAGGLPSAGGLGQMASGLASQLPSLPSGLPSLANLPSSLGGLTDQLPALPGGLGQLTGGLPGLGGGLPSLGDLPPLPGLGGPAGAAGLPSLDGLQLPDMPLAEGLGGAASAAGGTLQAGQQALGSLTSLASSASELPAAPPLPSLEKITEHIWKEVQRRLKVERERSRGLA
ncbi:MAG: DUF4157 domain-containing protein [Anaerolineales bacterium]|nr:DUF4157 domain-containing protein [Anaerolineales bacterium]